MPRLLAVSLSITCSVLALAGCTSQPVGLSAEAMAGHRQRLSLLEEPDGAVTPLDLRERADFAGGEVVLVGQVGGVANPYESLSDFPWKRGEATFFLVDPTTAAEYAEHSGGDADHAASCAFCQSHAADHIEAIAEVTFTDPSGKPLAVGAQPLLSLNEGDTVVVRGEAKMLPSPGGATADQLVVVASGLYIRR